jgi:hypothetical protein
MTDLSPAESHDVVNTPNGQGADDAGSPLELDGQWQLYATGGASVKVDGKTYRLRRPSMGQIKELRDALASVADAIRQQSDEAQIIQRLNQATGERLHEEIEQLDQKAPDFESELRRLHGEAKALADQNLTVGRELTNLVDESYWSWWRQVFQLLSFNGCPETWPSWAADATAPNQIMQHWRSNPLARG